MLPWMEYPYSMDCHRALLHEAEQARLARQALAGRQTTHKVDCGVTRSLGGGRSAKAEQLQARHETVAATTTLTARHSN
jgi:hypothetical protein